MNFRIKNPIILGLALMGGTSLYAPPSSAQAYGAYYGGGREFFRYGMMRERMGFRLGLCVGETLATAQPPVVVPMPQGGQPPAPLDPTTQAAIKAALQSCMAQFRGGNPQPSPTPEPQPQPQPQPSASPSPAPEVSVLGARF